MNLSAQSLRLTTAAVRHFAPYHKWDRNFFLLYVLLIWLGILMGFVPEITSQVEKHQSVPSIVPIHAAVFVGWLALLTIQVLLIRSRRADIHRKLGIAGMVLAGAMLVLGTATALIVHRVPHYQPQSDAAFVSVQLTDMLAFAGLAGAAFLLVGRPAAHKRLILLATLYISDAGFARWLGTPLQAHLGPGFWAFMAVLYLANDILILGLGAYDWITRHHLHPAYVAGVAWAAAMELTAVSLYLDPAWKPIALKLIGH